MLKRHIVTLDTESSGLDHGDGCEITEICAKAYNYWDLSPHHAGTFHCFIKPQRPEKAQPKALEVLGEGWTKAQKEGLEPKVVWAQFIKWMGQVNDEGKGSTKPIVYAYNQDHDRRFITETLKELKLVTKGDFGWEYPWQFMFDGMQSFYELFGTSPNITYSIKLDVALDMLGIKRSNGSIHSALEDTEKFSELMIRILKFQREAYKRLRITHE